MYVQCVYEFVVALKKADVTRSYLLGLHSSRGSVVIRRLGPQSYRVGGVPGDVCEHSV